MSVKYFVFEYLYRDASNYKAYDHFLLQGAADATHVASIRKLVNEEIFFIPEQIGIPSLRHELYKYSNGPTEDDHCFHEVVDLRPASRNEIQELKTWGTISELLNALSRTVPNS